MSLTIAVMAKCPECDEVKTRLAPRLAPDERALIYRAFLADKLAAVQQIRGVQCTLVYAPAHRRAWFASFAGAGVALHPQQERPLGGRISAAFAELLPEHADGVILTDSDTPNLPREHLEAAVQALREERELVLGPARDGGYYLIGLRRVRPELFADISWSTPAVLKQTLARAGRQRLETHLLPVWYDIDTPDDLCMLQEDIVQQRGGPCPATVAVLRRLGMLA